MFATCACDAHGVFELMVVVGTANDVRPRHHADEKLAAECSGKRVVYLDPFFVLDTYHVGIWI